MLVLLYSIIDRYVAVLFCGMPLCMATHGCRWTCQIFQILYQRETIWLLCLSWWHPSAVEVPGLLIGDCLIPTLVRENWRNKAYWCLSLIWPLSSFSRTDSSTQHSTWMRHRRSNYVIAGVYTAAKYNTLSTIELSSHRNYSLIEISLL